MEVRSQRLGELFRTFRRKAASYEKLGLRAAFGFTGT
jgi:hypothetical protein